MLEFYAYDSELFISSIKVSVLLLVIHWYPDTVKCAYRYCTNASMPQVHVICKCI